MCGENRPQLCRWFYFLEHFDDRNSQATKGVKMTIEAEKFSLEWLMK